MSERTSCLSRERQSNDLLTVTLDVTKRTDADAAVRTAVDRASYRPSQRSSTPSARALAVRTTLRASRTCCSGTAAMEWPSGVPAPDLSTIY
jgi:hypothetical protein